MRLIVGVFGFLCATAVCQAQMNIRVLPYPIRNSSATRALEVFSKEIEKQSAGQLRALASSAPKNPFEIPEVIRRGDADVGVASTIALGRVEPIYRVFELAFLFQDLGAVSKFESGMGGTILNQRLEKDGLKSLGLIHEGMWILASIKSVRNPSDLKGVKLATVAPNYLANQLLSSMGANVVSATPSDVIRLFERGAVDGYVGPFSQLASGGARISSDRMTVMRISYLGYAVLADAGWMTKLSDKNRQFVQRAARATEDQVNRETLEQIARLSNALSKISAIAQLKPQELDRWREAVRPSWVRFDRSVGVNLTDIASATGGGGDPCPKLSECRCDNRACKISCCQRSHE